MIRLAKKQDCQCISECVNAAYEPYIERIDRRPAPMLVDYAALNADSQVYVVPNVFGICGVLVLKTVKNALLIESVAVHPQYQGQGIGKRLIAFAEEKAHAELCQTVDLYTNEAMTENQAFYRKLGYQEVERRVEDGYRRVFMQKGL